MDNFTIDYQFGGVNYAVLVLYLFGMLALGYWCSRRVTGARSFFTADGRLNSVLVGLSILGTYLSALTMMALPRMSFGDANWTWTVQLPFLILTAFVITRYVLPRYREAGVISVYEYLERKIHVSSRTLASLCFIIFSIARNGLVLYLPALAFHIVTGFDLVSTIIVMGCVITLYTVMGGIEGVIWTDAVQVIIFVCAALFSLVYMFAGETVSSFLAVANERGKFQTLTGGLRLTEVTTVWLIVQTIVETIRIYGTQQDIAQRYTTTSSTRAAARSVWLAAVGYIPLGYLFYFIGTALFVYYQVHPDPNVDALMSVKKSADAIYPYFIVTHLPVGLAGLVIAAIFAAAMSSIDSLMNSSSTVCVEDFYKRFSRVERSETHCLKVARWLTVLWGALATGMALMFMGIDSAQVVWNKVMGISCNGVLGLMALAFLPFRVRPWTAVVGFLSSYAALFVMIYRTDINFLLWPVIGNIVCFAVAYMLNERAD